MPNIDPRPFITKRVGEGEYSTVQIGEIIETCWFGDDGKSYVVGRTYLGKASIAEKHISQWESSH